MIPRGVLVAGGVAVVAGGAVYVFQPEPSSERPVSTAQGDVRWVVEGGGSVDRSEDPLAIRDPLHARPASGPPEPFLARQASIVDSGEDPFILPSATRQAFVPDPELPPRFAAPASAPFVSGVSTSSERASLVPLGGAREAMIDPAGAMEGSLPLQGPTFAAEGLPSQSNRPVAIGRHRIKDGETLEQIAEANYGDPALADFLFEKNRRTLKYPDLLPVGKEIVLYAPPSNAPGAEALASSPVPQAAPPKMTLPGVATPELAPLD